MSLRPRRERGGEFDFQPTLTERAADVIAHAGDHTENPVAMRDGQFRATESDFGDGTPSELFGRTQIEPFGWRHMGQLDCRVELR